MTDVDIKATVFDINQSMLDEGVKRSKEFGFSSNCNNTINQKYSLSAGTLRNFLSLIILLMPTPSLLDSETSPERKKPLKKREEF